MRNAICCDKELKEIGRRADAATPEPWVSVFDENTRQWYIYTLHKDADYDPEGGYYGTTDTPIAIWTDLAESKEGNRPFVVSARSDLPALLATVAALKADLAAKEAGMARVGGQFDALSETWQNTCDENAELRFETSLNKEIRRCAAALLRQVDYFLPNMFEPERNALRHALDGDLPSKEV